jgi:hypothetical protein
MSHRFYARDELMTTAKASVYTGLPPRTLKYLADTRRLRYEVLVNAARPIRRFRRSALDALLREEPVASSKQSIDTSSVRSP